MAENQDLPKDTRKGDRHKPRTGDRHANPSRPWRPDKDLYEEAMVAVKDGLGWTMLDYLSACLAYVTGRRKSPPPRPQWAEERAAALPDEEPEQPGEG